MNIRTIIVDDDDAWREIISTYVATIPNLTLEGSYDSPQVAFQKLSEGNIDLAILDIDMPVMSGLSLVKSLKNPPAIIFVTSHADYAASSYDVEAIDFLTKPFEFDRFTKAIERVNKRLESNQAPKTPFNEDDELFFIRSQNSYIKLRFSEVLFVKAMENFIQIVTDTQKYTVLMPLSNIESQLPPEKFMRVHRSYIINMFNITSVERDTVNIKENSIPLSEQYKEKLIETMIEKRLLKK
jgi:two-component system, LytTR family, response regulator